MKKHLQRVGHFLTFLFTLSAGHLQAGDFSLNSLFSDHMVLQRNQPIRVFGTGTDRSEVVVRLAGQEARSTVSDGTWEVQLPVMTAGGPHTIEVVGPQKLILSDVMIGDVWVGSGQSNMGMALKSMPEYVKDPKSFGSPSVRIFKAKVAPAETPQREIQRVKTTTMDGWSAATPANSGEISAVGYYFCHAVQRELNVPIGFIHSAQGATSVEAWLDDKALHEVVPDSKRLNALTNPKNPSVFYHERKLHPTYASFLEGSLPGSNGRNSSSTRTAHRSRSSAPGLMRQTAPAPSMSRFHFAVRENPAFPSLHLIQVRLRQHLLGPANCRRICQGGGLMPAAQGYVMR